MSSAVDPSTAALADLVAQGSPALVSLALTRNGTPAGGHFVVAIGVASDGSILIHDPNPFFARTNLADYLAGFSAGAQRGRERCEVWSHFALRSPSGTRFLVGALSQPAAVMSKLALNVQSAAGSCGLAVRSAGFDRQSGRHLRQPEAHSYPGSRSAMACRAPIRSAWARPSPTTRS